MREEVAFAALLGLPGVSGVGAVRSQGVVKHYNVSYAFKNGRELDPGTLKRLAEVWPFGSIEADPHQGTVRVEFLVRPDEVAAFAAKMGNVRLPFMSEATAAIVVNFSDEVPLRLKEKFGAAVRAT
ncbi:MAG: hypothetical protein H5T97_02270, partial [Firmicutes bacterium]|nr:hypothetical protein [Bacillota bacterium]